MGHLEMAQSAALSAGCAGREVTGGSCSDARFIHCKPLIDGCFPAVRSRWGHHLLARLGAVSPTSSVPCPPRLPLLGRILSGTPLWLLHCCEERSHSFSASRIGVTCRDRLVPLVAATELPAESSRAIVCRSRRAHRDGLKLASSRDEQAFPNLASMCQASSVAAGNRPASHSSPRLGRDVRTGEAHDSSATAGFFAPASAK